MEYIAAMYANRVVELLNGELNFFNGSNNLVDQRLRIGTPVYLNIKLCLFSYPRIDMIYEYMVN